MSHCSSVGWSIYTISAFFHARAPSCVRPQQPARLSEARRCSGASAATPAAVSAATFRRLRASSPVSAASCATPAWTTAHGSHASVEGGASVVRTYATWYKRVTSKDPDTQCKELPVELMCGTRCLLHLPTRPRHSAHRPQCCALAVVACVCAQRAQPRKLSKRGDTLRTCLASLSKNPALVDRACDDRGRRRTCVGEVLAVVEDETAQRAQPGERRQAGLAEAAALRQRERRQPPQPRQRSQARSPAPEVGCVGFAMAVRYRVCSEVIRPAHRVYVQALTAAIK